MFFFRINTLNTRSLTGGTLSNQVSRLPVIGFGTDLIFRPKTENVNATPPDEEIVSSTTVTIESEPEVQVGESKSTTTSPLEHMENDNEKREQQQEEEEERERSRLEIDIPQNLMDKVTKRPNIDPNDRSGSLSSKYTIWDEGDSYIIENYDGEDIHVIPSSHNSLNSSNSSHNSSPNALSQEQNRSQQK
ncbi:hypothetical protein C1645_306849 [Glomus cerebriforme]|uniref:Uncharacterized protein n=1 Tax=Glomus cerebriforme TaxID=658196 RepID=A0A397TL16_9GLOM|nr:hypothetical protein C1645_306849 [Glomus cerebriforme]